MNIKFSHNNEEYSFFLHKDTISDGKQTYPYDGLSRNIFLKKTFYDVESLEHSAQFLTKDSVVCDCGAMIGNHTVFWGKRAKKVYAFEPFEESYELLAKNVAANNLQNVSVIKTVLDSQPRKHSPKRKSKHFGPTEFVSDPNGSYSSDTLDNLVKEKVDLLKIDVEGAEYEVLLGAKRILADMPIIYIEMHSLIGSDEHNKVMNLLKDAGYEKDKNLFVCDKWTAKSKGKK